MENKSKTVLNLKGEIIFFGLQHFLDDISRALIIQGNKWVYP
jgi:hypothetical protein